jgi:hypothetical protein
MHEPVEVVDPVVEIVWVFLVAEVTGLRGSAR